MTHRPEKRPTVAPANSNFDAFCRSLKKHHVELLLAIGNHAFFLILNPHRTL